MNFYLIYIIGCSISIGILKYGNKYTILSQIIDFIGNLKDRQEEYNIQEEAPYIFVLDYNMPFWIFEFVKVSNLI